MKTKSVLLAVFMSASVLAFANEPVNSKLAVVNQKESGIFKLIYKSEDKGSVKLNILDNSGAVVYQETFKSVGGFVRPVNFTGMEHGEYTIEIVDNTGKSVQKVNYAEKATISKVRIVKTPEAGKYLLAVANEGIDEVNVKIYNGASELVHNETLSINGNFGLIYNLKQITGQPTFTVTDKTGTIQIIK